ncbi:MAG: hypothetical protein ABI556_15155, partial [Gemmatimonadales bacterium]
MTKETKTLPLCHYPRRCGPAQGQKESPTIHWKDGGLDLSGWAIEERHLGRHACRIRGRLFSFSHESTGPIERVIEIPEKIFISDLFKYGRTRQRDQRLHMNLGQEYESSILSAAVNDISQRMHADASSLSRLSRVAVVAAYPKVPYVPPSQPMEKPLKTPQLAAALILSVAIAIPVQAQQSAAVTEA